VDANLTIHFPVPEGISPAVHLRDEVKSRCRLLAGGAHIHVDFHAHRHFDDLRCFPSHLALLLLPDEFRPEKLR
jgi:hypothetical protein